jgi:transketolase
VPNLPRPEGFVPSDMEKGAYVLVDTPDADIVLMATGSEVHVCVHVQAALARDGHKARVVSVPCLEAFLEQPDAVRKKVLPPGARLVAFEAGVTHLWKGVVRDHGLVIGLDTYGRSAPDKVLADKFGLTSAKVHARISAWLAERTV